MPRRAGMAVTSSSPSATRAAGKARVLVVHNAYQQRGGEDSVVEAEVAMLRAAGHDVELYLRHNDEVGAASRLQLAADALWSRRTSRDLDEVLERLRPELVHVHNTLPLVSPSVYWAASRARVPVVQTLHNFRLLCPQGLLLRDERVCEDCVGALPWRAVRHRCYRQSASQSAVVAATLTLHRAVGTYRHHVTRYIALNQFCRDKFVQGGLPAARLRIKPNFVDLPAPPRWDAAAPRDAGLFVGRLSAEKGIGVLIRALQPDVAIRGEAAPPRVRFVGTGELEGPLRAAVGADCLGFKPLPEILALMRRASYLVLPSIWYENFPRTIVEAYACGLPVIASRLGALPEIVLDGVTGLLFEPGCADDLARTLRWAAAHPAEMVRMGRQARARYEQLYTPQRNYDTLVDIYDEALRLPRAAA